MYWIRTFSLRFVTYGAAILIIQFFIDALFRLYVDIGPMDWRLMGQSYMIFFVVGGLLFTTIDYAIHELSGHAIHRTILVFFSKHIVLRGLLNGFIGLSIEFLWTSAFDVISGQQTLSLWVSGTSYIWMIGVYGVGILILEWLIRNTDISQWNMLTRGTTYALACFAWEMACGYVIYRLTGVIPWDYSQNPNAWTFAGFINLYYFPAWFVFGFGLEYLITVTQPQSEPRENTQ